MAGQTVPPISENLSAQFHQHSFVATQLQVRRREQCQALATTYRMCRTPPTTRRIHASMLAMNEMFLPPFAVHDTPPCCGRERVCRPYTWHDSITRASTPNTSVVVHRYASQYVTPINAENGTEQSGPDHSTVHAQAPSCQYPWPLQRATTGIVVVCSAIALCPYVSLVALALLATQQFCMCAIRHM